MHSHQFLILAVTTKTGRQQIQRHSHMTVLAVLILAPDINDLGHVALFVTPKR